MESRVSPNLTRLRELNDERAMELLPVIIYMCILAVVGVLGNSLILYIYCKRFKRSSSSYFIICLAGLDMIACVLGMPFDVIDIRYGFVFDNPAACKVLRFITYYTVIGSALILIAIAVDRYFKICKPLQRVGMKMKYGVIGSLALAALLASPALIVFGTKKLDLEPGVAGVDCSVSDKIKGTAWPIIYFIILVLVFVVSVLSLVLLYWRVVCSLIKRKRQMQDAASATLTRRHKHEKGLEEEKEKITTVSFKCTSNQEDDDSNAYPTRGVLMAVPQSQWKVPTERTTAIFVCISIGFLLSFFPCLLIMILREFLPDVINFPNRAADIAYQIFLRSYFINNVINPLIYGFFNPSFRREVKRIFWLCGCSCCAPAKVTGNGPSSSNDTTLTSGTTSRT